MNTFFCVTDFEATCQDNLPPEIIEFPSVLYKRDNNKLTYISEFQKYCKPNHKLSEFCTKLTGITRNIVDNAKIFPIVMSDHYTWLVKQTNNKVNETIFVSCGSWDFKVALQSELERWTNDTVFSENYPNLYKFIKKPPKVYNKFIDIKELYASFYGRKKCSMVSMLNYLGLSLDGKHHSGLDDSKNIGKILQKIFEDSKNIDEYLSNSCYSQE